MSKHPHFVRIDGSLLYQPFLRKWETVIDNCIKRGHHYWATSGHRTWEEQDKLYAKGRTIPPLGPNRVVTNAKGGEGNHNFFCAGDSAYDANPDKPGLQPEYRMEQYRVLAEEATKEGLEAGFYWKSFPDGPHVQLPLRAMGIKLAHLRAAYLRGGRAAVFELFDEWQAKYGKL